MSYLDDKAQIAVSGDAGGGLHALYVVFCPGATVARTIQVGRDTDCHAYIDIDADRFPTALELKGWKRTRVTPPPAAQPMDREKTIKTLLALAFELLRTHDENENSLSKIPDIAEKAGELAGAL